MHESDGGLYGLAYQALADEDLISKSFKASNRSFGKESSNGILGNN